MSANVQCWNCGCYAPLAPTCALCGASLSPEDADLAAQILDIEAAHIALRAKLAHLHNAAMRRRCPMLASKASVCSSLIRGSGDDVEQLRDRLREDVERKTATLKAVK